MRQLSRAIITLLVSTIILTARGSGADGSGGGGSRTKWTGTKQLGVVGADTKASDIAVDSSSNVYVTGASDGGLNGNMLTGTTNFHIRNDSVGKKQSERINAV